MARSLRDGIASFLRAPDPRPEREVVADIREELELHLALRERDLRAAGIEAHEARRRAVASFGDVDRVQDACRRIQIGERDMLQRVNAVLLAVLLAGVAVLGWQFAASRARASEEIDELRAEIGALTTVLRERGAGVSSIDGAVPGPPGDRASGRREALEVGADPVPLDPEAWARRMRATQDADAALAIAREIIALDPDSVWEVLRHVYAQVPFSEARKRILKLFALREGHLHAVKILDLGANDPDLGVQGWAFQYLRKYAYRDFSADHSAYVEWAALYAHRPLDEVLSENARELARRLSVLEGADLLDTLETLSNLDLRPGDVAGVDLADVLRDGGLLATIDGWLFAADTEVRRIGLRWLAELDPGETYLRDSVLPLLDAEGEDAGALESAALTALGRPGNLWAVDPVLERMTAGLREKGLGLFAYSSALATIGDARVVPTLIAMIEANEGYETVYGIGYFGLEPLTGVSYDESHDGAFWRAWWRDNAQRMPESARGLQIPNLGD